MRTTRIWRFRKKKKKKILLEVRAPHKGTAKELSSLDDEIFSDKILGQGLAIEPLRAVKKLDILAPISGKLVTIFPMRQAFAIKASGTKEVLVHIGTNALDFKEEWVTTYVTENKIVRAGTKLATINFNLVKKALPLAATIVIVPSGHEVKRPKFGVVKAQDVLFKI